MTFVALAATLIENIDTSDQKGYWQKRIKDKEMRQIWTEQGEIERPHRRQDARGVAESW